MKRIAVIEGGYSSEKEVSIKSAKTVFNNLDRTKYKPTMVIVDENEWAAYDDQGRYKIDKHDFSFTKNSKKISFDFAFIVIHGTPGEDGTLQGYFDLIGLKYSTPSQLATTLTFNKFYCNKFLHNFDIPVADSILIQKGESYNIREICNQLKLPCFVKPTDGGSSFGITKVVDETEFDDAISLAFKHGTQVIIESFIEGRELSNGVYLGKDGIKVLPITEIISYNDFFDYEAKYNGESDEITPANISKDTRQAIEKLTYKIFNLLGMSGIARADYILTNENEPCLIEINTVPGMSDASIIPQMIEAGKFNMMEVLGDIVETNLC